MSFRVLRSLCQQLFAANIDVDLFRCWLADKAECGEKQCEIKHGELTERSQSEASILKLDTPSKCWFFLSWSYKHSKHTLFFHLDLDGKNEVHSMRFGKKLQ